MEFRGKKIFEDHGYPAVYWPDHPLARKHGVVRVHRVIAYEKYGDLAGLHVHHLDEDKWNWSPENLAALSASEHAEHHYENKVKETREGKRGFRNRNTVDVLCGFCSQLFSRTYAHANRSLIKYCSQKCAQSATARITWPNLEELLELVNVSGYKAAGRELGVSDNAIRKHIRVRLKTKNARMI